MGIIDRVCVCVSGCKGITDQTMMHVLRWSEPQQWPPSSVTDSLFLSFCVCLCHPETVCDRHLQQAHSGADGLPHGVSKPQIGVCVYASVSVCVFAHEKYLGGVQFSHIKGLTQNLTVEGPLGGDDASR